MDVSPHNDSQMFRALGGFGDLVSRFWKVGLLVVVLVGTGWRMAHTEGRLREQAKSIETNAAAGMAEISAGLARFEEIAKLENEHGRQRVEELRAISNRIAIDVDQLKQDVGILKDRDRR